MEEPKFMRINGMPQATPNGDTKDIRFAFTIEDQPSPLFLVARYGVAQQIASGLGTCLHVLRAALAGEGVWEPVSAEQVREMRLHKDQFSEKVVVELITEPLGIPYLFQIPSQIVSEFADLLKSEANKPTSTGNA